MGRDSTIVGVQYQYQTHNYLVARGPGAHNAFVDGLGAGGWDSEIRGKENIADLRDKLLLGAERPPEPRQIKVTGTLFPCALLSSGWWERHRQKLVAQIKWRDPIQEWLFHGFDLWGPSWDFTWQFDKWDTTKKRPYFIAQIGDGDEANSLPVLIPAEKAHKLYRYIHEAKDAWGGIDAEVTGVLGHRKFFRGNLDPGALELFGGLLDYCLWLDEDNPDHGIEPLLNTTGVYSGYLWKCVAPAEVVASGKASLDQVYFIWEHTNFASRSAVQYNLDSLVRKEQYLTARLGDLKLVQKSSWLVPGTPDWPPEEIYRVLLRKADRKI